MIRIRPFQSEDAPALLAMFLETIRRVNARDYSPEQIRAWASDDIDPVEFGKRFDGRVALVAEWDGRPVGFTELEADGHVDRFYVSADHQSQGVGSAMLKWVIEEAERLGLTRLFLEASITARPFFERAGFATLARQTVMCRGVELTNFRMERMLE